MNKTKILLFLIVLTAWVAFSVSCTSSQENTSKTNETTTSTTLITTELTTTIACLTTNRTPITSNQPAITQLTTTTTMIPNTTPEKPITTSPLTTAPVSSSFPVTTSQVPITTQAPTTTPPIVHTISPAQAKEMMDTETVTIVDVRRADEYASGHIPGAILAPNETILSEAATLLPDKNAVLLIYCRSGRRSAEAAQKLISLGYTNVYDFGGILDWEYDITQ